MRTNVRIGNDIKLLWEVLRGGYPVNFNNATDIKVSILQGGKYSCEDKTEISTFEIDTEQNNLLNIEIQADKITELGYLWVVLEYTIGDHGMVDGNRKITIDNLPVKIVGLSDEAGQVFEFEVTSDVVVGFDGKSAFEVWLTQNPDKTEEDYFNWLQKPATDAVSLIEDKIETLDTAIQQEEQRELAEGVRLSNEQSRFEAEGSRVSGEVARNTAEGIRVGNENTRIENEGIRLLAEEDRIDAEETRVGNETLRISAELLREGAESDREDAEQLRQTNTSTAIQNANEATQSANNAAELANTKAGEANTAAQNADDARLAIQDDLALKANHGYDSSPKTLKEVEDDTINTTEKPTAQSLSELNARITALEAILSNKIKDRVDITKEFNVWGKTNLILYGNGASTKTPDFIGQTYIDTTNGNVYIAVGVSNAGNWKLV